MSKYGWLFLTTSLMIITNMIATELTLTASSVNIYQPENADATISSVGGFFDTYWGLITFSISGVPDFISVFFLLLNIVIIYIVLELAIKFIQALPFT